MMMPQEEIHEQTGSTYGRCEDDQARARRRDEVVLQTESPSGRMR